MNKLISLEEAVAKIHDGMTVMIGGFLGCGSPAQITDALVEHRYEQGNRYSEECRHTHRGLCTARHIGRAYPR